MSSRNSVPCDSPPAKVDPYAVWRSRNYRRYSVSWFSLVFSKQVETVAVGIYIYDRTRDPLNLGWIGLVQALPVMLLAIAGGQIADRWDRRRVLLVTFSISAAVSCGLLLTSLWDAPVRWMYLLLGLGAINQALGFPSRGALLPQLVPEEIFSKAITWNSTIFQIASMTGPAVGGLVLGAEKNAPAAFALVTACRLVAAGAIAGVRSGRKTTAVEAISLASVIAGVRYVWAAKLILATITLDLFAVLLGGATYLLPVFAEDILHVGASGLGFLRSSEAAGAVCMALLMAHLPPMQRAGRTLLWAVAGFGAATIVFGFSPWFWLSLAMMFLIGAFDNVSVVVRHTLVQMLTPDPMRGRVSAVNGIFIVASNDLGGLESGVTARLFGPLVSVVGGGIGAILVVLAAAWKWPQILTIGSLEKIRPAQLMVEQEEQAELV
jgi:MFS family permease